MGILRISIFLLIWAAFEAPGVLHAQNTPFQNPSLDSNCYFPQIGNLSEMDTICGSDSNQYLGSPVIKNMGPKPDGSFGNMLIGDLVPPPVLPFGSAYTLSQVQTGPGFNLHQMKQYFQSIEPNASNGLSVGFVLGHFRDTKHLDIFAPYHWRIYWADDAGNYDSNRFTQLWTHIQGDYGIYGGLISPFAGYFSNDTVEDIINGIATDWLDRSKDTCYLELFKGPSLYLKDTAFEDTSCILFPSLANNPYRFMLLGDFRGTERQDVIIMSGASGLPGTRIGDISFYSNDPPFSLAKLAQAINYDTLMARWQNPKLLSGNYESYTTLAMSALPKHSGDKSLEFMPVFSDTSNNVGIYIFRGGPNFGSHRITLDSAAYVIHQPSIFQKDGWPVSIADAGDMTGTGNHVLYTSARNDVGDYWWDAFFVTGQALDDKIDIYNSHSYSESPGDTLTANSDSLEDYLFRLAWPDAPNGPTGDGGLWLYYGSKNIPVHLNPQFSNVVVNIPQENGAGISFSPNPVTRGWSVATIIWPEAESNAEYGIYDMLGREVQHGTLRLLGGAEQQRIYFSGLPQGTYIYVITGSKHSASTKIVKLSPASGSSAGLQPNIIQQLKQARDGGMIPSAPGSGLP